MYLPSGHPRAFAHSPPVQSHSFPTRVPVFFQHSPQQYHGHQSDFQNASISLSNRQALQLHIWGLLSYNPISRRSCVGELELQRHAVGQSE